MGMLTLKTNAQTDREKQKEAEDLLKTEDQEAVEASLVGHLRKAWEAAKRNKIDVEQQILRNMRQIAGEYDPDKLQQIREFGGSEAYLLYTQTKWRSANAWISDVLNDIPFDIEPTPKPSLGESLEDRLIDSFMDKMLEKILEESAQSGQPVDANFITQQIEQAIPDLQEGAKKVIMDYAKAKAQEMKDQIQDQLVEGDWYEAIENIVPDIFMKCGILKGPIVRIEKQRKVKYNETTGVPTIYYADEKVPQYERRPSLDIYPGPGVTSFQKGYFFDRLRYTPTDIQGFLDLPGFNEDEIREVLKEAREPGSKLREWTMIDVDRAEAEQNDPTMLWDWDEIDCLEYHGPIQGKKLHDWSKGMEKKAPDPDKFYDVEAYLIGGHVIKAVLNPNPLGERNYSKTSFINLPDSFFGLGLPEVIQDIQGAINSCIRALCNNIGMASGPQVTIDESVLTSFEKGEMTPWKRWWVKYQEGVSRGTIKAIEFYQPTLIASQLVEAIKFLMALGDEFTIPGWAHGNPQAGGAGTTASGFSMFQTASSRGVKLVLKNMDRNIIEDSIQRQFDWNMDRKKFSGLVGDMKIVAKGVRSLIAKEQQAARMTELSGQMSNQFWQQILGPEGATNLLKAILKAHEINPLDIKSDWKVPVVKPMALPDQAKSMGLNEAGDKTQGKDFQTEEGAGPKEAPAPPQ
jgi:hypothetical protein